MFRLLEAAPAASPANIRSRDARAVDLSSPAVSGKFPANAMRHAGRFRPHARPAGNCA